MFVNHCALNHMLVHKDVLFKTRAITLIIVFGIPTTRVFKQIFQKHYQSVKKLIRIWRLGARHFIKIHLVDRTFSSILSGRDHTEFRG